LGGLKPKVPLNKPVMCIYPGILYVTFRVSEPCSLSLYSLSLICIRVHEEQKNDCTEVGLSDCSKLTKVGRIRLLDPFLR